MINTERNDNLSRKIDKMVPGDNSLYKIIKNKKSNDIPALYIDNNRNNRYYSDSKKSTLLAHHFADMHKNPLEKHNIIWTIGIEETVKRYLRQHINMTPILLTSKEVHSEIVRLKPNKATGPDNIPTRAIKNFSHIAFHYLTITLNMCIVSGHFPNQWKIA